MIEFAADDNTRDQVHTVFQETTVLLTMLTRPDLHDAAEWGHQAERTYALSPPHALVVLASVGAERSWLLLQGHRGADQVSRSEPFPRAVLQTVPSNGRPDLLFLAIDLVEAVAHGRRARTLVDQLLVEGLRGYQILLSAVHELGWLAAHANPAIGTLVQLVALEAATAEQNWIESQKIC